MPIRIAATLVAVLVACSSYAQSQKGKTGKAPPPPPDCEQMAAQSHGAISVEACKQMMSMQQAYTAASSDPSASRAGDDKMTCEQIAAEFKQQQFTAPDKAKVAEAQAATDDFKKGAEKAQKEATAEVAKESAEESVLSRLALTNAMAAAEAKRIEAEQKKLNERITKEQAPKAERMFSAFGDLTGDIGKQIAANPRLARLYQLADQKHCTAQQLK